MEKTVEIQPETPLTLLPGVGPERAAQLARLDCRTVEDLLWLKPRRHEDRRQASPIADLELHRAVTVKGKVTALGVKRYRHGTKSVFELILEDGTARLHCRWWNQPYLQNQFQVGEELMVFGKPIDLKPRTMDHPEIERLEGDVDEQIHLHRIVPVYPLTEGLPQRWLRRLVYRLVFESDIAMPERWPQLDLRPWPMRDTALRWLHFPSQPGQPEQARQRLALDEFIALHLELRTRRKKLSAHTATACRNSDNRWIKPWLTQLGFNLTGAQTRVLREIRQDLAQTTPMRRLLQGDVGAGKTVVAAASALMVLESGWNVVLMAPTEILAEQHRRTFNRWFQPLGIPVLFHTGSRKDISSEAGEANPAAQGHKPPRLVVGTHALFEKGFELDRIGLVVIDEQHKFGVAQRETLLRKGRHPHLLVMTATPIPRTLGLTLYGDLDCSLLDEKPAGRGRVRTFVRPGERLPKVWDFVRQRLDEGHQAYVVYPLVDESENAGLKAVTREWEALSARFSPRRIGLLHGRLTSEEKEEVMRRFGRGDLSMLVATTVIEVGLDVANATVMVVENAEQFGLAQLHQLRGRIGRGAHESYCILIAAAKSKVAAERLQVLADTDDGFKIAEADLVLRGPGEFLGRQQSGAPSFRFGDLTADLKLLERARDYARQFPD